MNSKLFAYAMDFASFLIQKIKRKEAIRNIILFGSVAREEAGKASDIDLFIDVVQKDPAGEREIKQTIDQFIQSTKYLHYWKPLGIENQIKLTIGRFAAWKELQPSIIANGIVLYGKFKPSVSRGEHKTFFIWENIKPNAKRVLFNKQLYGYKQNGKHYDGLIQKYDGERLGKGCIIVPLEHALPFQRLFKKYKIAVKIKKVLEY